MQNGHFNKRVRMCQQSHGGHILDMLPYITLYCILYESIKNLQFLIINLCFLSKIFLAWILGHFIQTHTHIQEFIMSSLSSISRYIYIIYMLHIYNVIYNVIQDKSLELSFNRSHNIITLNIRTCSFIFNKITIATINHQ